MDDYTLKLPQNCNNSNKSFNLSLKKRKILWLHTLRHADNKIDKKHNSIDSKRENNRRRSINDIDTAYSNYINEESSKKIRKNLRRSSTFSNINFSNIDADRYSMYKPVLVDQINDEKTKNKLSINFESEFILSPPPDKISNRKYKSANKNVEQSMNIMLKTGEKVEHIEEKSKIQDNSLVTDQYAGKSAHASINYDTTIAISPENKLKVNNDVENIQKESPNVSRFEGFFNSLENNKETSKNLAVTVNGKDVKLRRAKEGEVNIGNVNLKLQPSVKMLHFMDVKEENNAINEDTTLCIQLHQNMNTKKQDLTYDDRYLYGSFKEDNPSKEGNVVVGQLFPKDKLSENEKSPRRSVHKLLIDVMTKIPFPKKKDGKKTKSKSKHKRKKQNKDSDSKNSDNEDSQDQDDKKEKVKTKDRAHASVSSMKSEKLNGIEEGQIYQSVELDEFEPIEIIEQFDSKDVTVKDNDGMSMSASSEKVNPKTRKEQKISKDKKSDFHNKTKDKSNVKPGTNKKDSEIMENKKNLKSVKSALNETDQMELITMKILDELVGDSKVNKKEKDKSAPAKSQSVETKKTEQSRKKDNNINTSKSQMDDEKKKVAKRTPLNTENEMETFSGNEKIKSKEIFSQINKEKSEMLKSSRTEVPLNTIKFKQKSSKNETSEKDRLMTVENEETNVASLSCEKQQCNYECKRIENDSKDLMEKSVIQNEKDPLKKKTIPFIIETKESEQSSKNDFKAYKNELIEVVSQVSSNSDPVANDISQRKRYEESLQKETHSGKSPHPSDNVNSRNGLLTEVITIPEDIDGKTKLMSNRQLKSHAHVDVLIENRTECPACSLAISKPKFDSSLLSKNTGCSLSTCLKSRRKPSKTTGSLSQSTRKSNYSIKDRSKRLYTGEKIPMKSFRPLGYNSRIYRCNEMLLSNRLSLPTRKSSDMKNNAFLDKNTSKTSFWCLPYKNPSKSLTKENTSLKFSYKATCTDCQGKSLQTFQLLPQSPEQNYLTTPESSTRTTPARRYLYSTKNDKRYTENKYGYQNSEEQKSKTIDEPYLKLYRHTTQKTVDLFYKKDDKCIEKRSNIVKDDPPKEIKTGIFEIQDFSDGDNEDVNASVYFEIEDKYKEEKHLMKINQQNLAHLSHRNLLNDYKKNFMCKSAQYKGDNINKDRKPSEVDVQESINTGSKSSKITEFDDKNQNRINSKYEAIVFNSDTRNEPDKILLDLVDSEEKTEKIHKEENKIDNEERSSFKRSLTKINPKNSPGFQSKEDIKRNEVSLPFLKKESLTVTPEDSNRDGHTKSTKPEYFDTVDLDNVVQETYSLYRPLKIVDKYINKKRPKIFDSEFSDNSNQSKTKEVENDYDKIPPVTDSIYNKIFSFPQYMKETISEKGKDLFEEEEPLKAMHFEQEYNNSVCLKLCNHGMADQETYTFNKVSSFENDLTSEQEDTKHLNYSNNSQLFIKDIDSKKKKLKCKPSEAYDKEKLNGSIGTSTEDNTDRQILKESARALNLNQPWPEDPNELMISSYEPPTFQDLKKSEETELVEKEEINAEKDETIIKSANSKESFLVECKKKNFFSYNTESTGEMKISDKPTQNISFPNNLPVEHLSVLSEDSEDFQFQKDPLQESFVKINDEILDDLCFYDIDRIVDLICVSKPHMSKLSDIESFDNNISHHETEKETLNKSANNSTCLCCYFCQCRVPQKNYEEHIEGCTKGQKNLITQAKLNPGKNERNVKDKPLSSMPGTICFICGCYYTKHSILIHEVACRKKWIKWNEQLPKCQRKPIPQKPFFSDEMIRENYEQEKHRGNNKFKLKDAVNKLIYEARLKNHIDFEI